MGRGPAKKTAVIHIRLEPELKSRIVHVAELEQRSLTIYILRTLREAVEAYEANQAARVPKKKAAAR